MTENTEDLKKVNHILPIEEVPLDGNNLNENEINLSNESNQESSEFRSEVTSSKSIISDEESDDEILDQTPDNVSLCLSMVQEENDKLKSNIENLELIVTQQQKKINENNVVICEFEQKCFNNEKLRSDLDNRLQTVGVLMFVNFRFYLWIFVGS